VFLFFVISGFPITANSRARWGRLAAKDVRAFYRRRAARILPCLLVLVAVLCGLALAGVPHTCWSSRASPCRVPRWRGSACS
jgi:peptidoglycan/LPS O-acetylase OafA/YrhL